MANQILTLNVTEEVNVDGNARLPDGLKTAFAPGSSSTVFSLVQGQILVNNMAGVLESAVAAKNGYLYVMSGVLTPPSIEPVLPHRCDITETKTLPVSLRKTCLSLLGPG